VLFEMLTGARAFDGSDPTDTIATILRSEPDWSRLPAETPEAIRRLVRRCLAKDAAQRLADIRDARLEIDDAGREPVPAPSRRDGPWRERIVWIAALIGTLIAAVTLVRLGAGASSPSLSEMRLDIATPPTTDPVSFALSPDGTHVVYVASSNGQPQLWLRSISTESARPLSGTEGASLPFWSPDSRSVGFFSAERLYRIAIDGGSPTPVAFAAVGAGGAWSPGGEILFPSVPDSPLSRVAETGGETRPVAGYQPPGGERFPQWLSDGRHFLYYVAESRAVFIGDLASAERRRLLDADAAAVFAPPDQVLFVLDDTLFAQTIDVEGFTLVGERVRLAGGVAVDRARGAAAVSASAVGSVLYRTGAFDQRRQLAWVDRHGAVVETIGEPDAAGPLNPAISPDGRRVALSRSRDGNTDIWLHELGREGFSRFTFESPPEIVPIWSPDGSRLLFARAGGGNLEMFVKEVASSGPGEVVLRGPDLRGIPLDWSNDTILFRRRDPDGDWDIWSVNATGDRIPAPVVSTPFADRSAKLSPDGRWLLYESDDSGRFESYVQPFPRGERSPVSSSGGSQPQWRADGREIFYIAPDGALMAVPVARPGNGLRLELGPPTRLFQAAVEGTVQGGITHAYAPSADGQRFLMTTFIELVSAPLTIVLNRPVGSAP
jgi:dipeptidyl aminopeptidase/acylaminoacyl peptidase